MSVVARSGNVRPPLLVVVGADSLAPRTDATLPLRAWTPRSSCRIGDNRSVTGARSVLRESGFVWIRSAFTTPAEAFAKSKELIGECAVSNGQEALSVIGDFMLAPPAGKATRDFQTLHFDFGVPLCPVRGRDVA